MSAIYRLYVEGLLHLFAGRRAEARQSLQGVSPAAMRDPCGWYYVARAFAYPGDVELALEHLERSVRGGFFCFPWMARDPWIDALRHHSHCRTLLGEAEARHRGAAEAFAAAGGDRLLGLVRT
jgi:hypothetical protein